MIVEVMNLYDKLESLEYENKAILAALGGSPKDIGSVDPLTQFLINKGKEMLIKDICYWSRNVNSSVNDDGVRTYETFENWKKHSIRNDQFPTEFSIKEVMMSIEDNLYKIYEEELKKEQKKYEDN